MPKPSIRAIQRLYAMSGNRCAFSGCPAPIIEDSPGMAGINMGEICHIRASKPGGERYDPEQTDAERHGYENLILLCRRHHKLIDTDTIEFSVARLLAMKQDHEQLAGRPENTADAFSAKRLLDAMDRITIAEKRAPSSLPALAPTSVSARGDPASWWHRLPGPSALIAICCATRSTSRSSITNSPRGLRITPGNSATP
jgi:hypothetical protein